MKKKKIVVAGLFSAIMVTGWAEPIPAPVNGVVTIDISSNVTYDEPLPAASQLVKRGTGTATLTKSSSDFSPVGEGVLIEGGTLAITDADALGTSEAARAATVVIRPGAVLLLRECEKPLTQSVVAEVDKASNLAGKIRAESGANACAGALLSRPAKERLFEIEVGSSASADASLSLTGNSVISNQVRKMGPGTLVVAGRLEMLSDPALQYRLQANGGTIAFAPGAIVTNVDFSLCSATSYAGALLSGGDISFTTVNADYGKGQNTRPIRQTGGDVRIVPGQNHFLNIGHGDGNMSSYYLEGGTLSHHGVRIACLEPGASATTPARGVFVQRGGRIVRPTGNLSLMIGEYGTAVWRQTGGTNDNNAAGFGENNPLGKRTSEHVTVEVEGSNTLYQSGIVRWGSAEATGRIVVSVRDGGTLAIHKFMYGNNDTARTCDASLFFDGGVFKILCAGYVSGSTEKPDGIFVGEKGIVIDTSDCRNIVGGVRTSIGEAIQDISLRSLAGAGLASVSLPETVAFAGQTYKGPAVIDIEGAGRGAAAYADWDFENACLVPHVSAPGYGLDTDTTKVYIWSADGKTRHECPFALKAAPTSGAGLTKRGEGSLNLMAANSYLGLTTVESGNIRMTHPQGIPETSGVILAKGTQLNLRTNELHVVALGGQGEIKGEPNAAFPNAGSVTLADGGTIYVKAADFLSEDWTPLAFRHGLTVGTGVKIVVTDPENLLEEGRQAKTLLTAGTLNLESLPSVEIVGGSVAKVGNALTFSYRKKWGTIVIVK